jgi:hypothetical protein
MVARTKVLLFLCLWSKCVFAANFTPTIDLPNISITTNELVEISNSTYKHLVDINGNPKTKGTLKIDHIELELPVSDRDIKNFPTESYNANLSIVSYDSKIESLHVDLSDHSNKLRLSGSDKDSIDIVKNDLTAKFNQYKNNFTGLGFRFFLILFTTILWIIFDRPILRMFGIYPESKFYYPILYLPYPVLFLFNFMLMGFMSEPFLPGFYVSETNPAWYDEHSGMIGLIGLIIPIIHVLITFIKRRRNSLTK